MRIAVCVPLLLLIKLHIANKNSLFRPYIKLDLQHANLYPRDMCIACANEISGLMNTLRAMYGLRRVCLAVTSLALSATTIHLLNLPSEPAASHLTQGLRDLRIISVNHPFAARCIEIIRTLAIKWNIALPEPTLTMSGFGAEGQQRWPSPTSSTFWAASIPRREHQERSASSDRSSTLQPPPALPQQRSPVTPFSSNPPMPLDPSQVQTPFWTPFPGQTMPLPPPHIVPSMAVDYSSTESHSGQWPMCGNAAGDQSYHMSDDAGHRGDWQWQ